MLLEPHLPSEQRAYSLGCAMVYESLPPSGFHLKVSRGPNIFRREIVYLDNLGPTRRSLHDPHARPRHPREFGKESHAFVVCFPIHGRRGEIEFQNISQPARNRGTLGPWM